MHSNLLAFNQVRHPHSWRGPSNHQRTKKKKKKKKERKKKEKEKIFSASFPFAGLEHLGARSSHPERSLRGWGLLGCSGQEQTPSAAPPSVSGGPFQLGMGRALLSRPHSVSPLLPILPGSISPIGTFSIKQGSRVIKRRKLLP